MTSPPPKPLPEVDAESRPFWAAAAAGRLALPRCEDCGRFHYYPRALCPHCHSDRIAWRDVSGSGTVYTFTIQRRPAGPAFAADVPYVVALIDLAEGVRMMSNIVTRAPERIRIGAPVVARFERVSDAIGLPKFVLADEAE